MVYDYDSFLVLFSGWLKIIIVFWAIENNLVYLRSILAGSVIIIVSWAIENNLVYLSSILVGL